MLFLREDSSKSAESKRVRMREKARRLIDWHDWSLRGMHVTVHVHVIMLTGVLPQRGGLTVQNLAGALVARSGLLGQAKRGCVPLPDFPPPTLSTGDQTISKFRYSITNCIEQRNRDTLNQPQSWLTPITYVLPPLRPFPQAMHRLSHTTINDGSMRRR